MDLHAYSRTNGVNREQAKRTPKKKNPFDILSNAIGNLGFGKKNPQKHTSDDDDDLEDDLAIQDELDKLVNRVKSMTVAPSGNSILIRGMKEGGINPGLDDLLEATLEEEDEDSWVNNPWVKKIAAAKEEENSVAKSGTAAARKPVSSPPVSSKSCAISFVKRSGTTNSDADVPSTMASRSGTSHSGSNLTHGSGHSFSGSNAHASSIPSPLRYNSNNDHTPSLLRSALVMPSSNSMSHRLHSSAFPSASVDLSEDESSYPPLTPSTGQLAQLRARQAAAGPSSGSSSNVHAPSALLDSGGTNPASDGGSTLKHMPKHGRRSHAGGAGRDGFEKSLSEMPLAKSFHGISNPSMGPHGSVGVTVGGATGGMGRLPLAGRRAPLK